MTSKLESFNTILSCNIQCMLKDKEGKRSLFCLRSWTVTLAFMSYCLLHLKWVTCWAWKPIWCIRHWLWKP